MSALTISCFAILLKRSLQLHHKALLRPNGRLLPEVERWLTLLGNDFELPLSPEAERELQQGHDEKVALEITLPPGAAPAAFSLSITGIFVRSQRSAARPALMPCSIQVRVHPGFAVNPSVSSSLTPAQWPQILEHLSRPEKLCGILASTSDRATPQPRKHRPVLRRYASIHLSALTPQVA